MRIPDDVSDCVAFLCVKKGDGSYRYGGTAFLIIIHTVESPYSYFVTAKHCIEKGKQEGTLYLRLNTRDGNCEFVKVDTDWIYPDDDAIDVAVLPIEVDFKKYQLIWLPDQMIATDEIMQKEFVGIGDEIVISGLFTSRYGNNRNIPILRAGHIAAMPSESLVDEATGKPYFAYLVEVRSLGGLSGSPVFAYLDANRVIQGRAASKAKLTDLDARSAGMDQILLLGLVRGHWDNYSKSSDSDFSASLGSEKINQGIAIVTPIQEAMKIINGEELLKERNKSDRKLRLQKAPTLDSAFDTDPPFTKRDFESAL